LRRADDAYSWRYHGKPFRHTIHEIVIVTRGDSHTFDGRSNAISNGTHRHMLAGDIMGRWFGSGHAMNPISWHVLYHVDNIYKLVPGDVIVDTVGIYVQAVKRVKPGDDPWVCITGSYLHHIHKHTSFWQLMT
jgi:hypothetical protein